MSFTNDQLFERDNQPKPQERVPNTLEPSYPHSSLSNHFSSRHNSNDSGRSSGKNSTQLQSPTGVDTNEMVSALNGTYSVPFQQQLKPPSFFGHGGNGVFSTSPTSSTACPPFNNGAGLDATLYPVDNFTGVQYTNPKANMNLDLNYHEMMGQGYDNNAANNAALWPAAQNLFGNYDYMNTNVQALSQINTNFNHNRSLPMSASTQELFQNSGPASHHIPIDQVPINQVTRSPSPLYEIDQAQADGEMGVEEASSPELTEIQHRRVLSDTTPYTSPRTPAKHRHRSLGISSHKGANRRLSTTHLDPEERAERAAAAQGLEKGDKRRMQNKLAQRAFRARSKIVNNDAAGRLEHLEQLNEQQAGRIGNLTELVGRLQKENYSMKSARFQETLMKNGVGGLSGPTA